MFDFLDKTGIKFLLGFVKSKLSGKSDSGHTHSKADITDFPASLPANGGNADTVGGKSASEFMPYIGYVEDLRAINQNCICSYDVNTLNTPYKSGKTLSSAGICIVNNINGILPTYFVICTGAKQCFISYQNNGEFVSDWKEISTTPIKKISFPSVATNAGGGGSLFSADFGTPITIACTSRAGTQCTPFFADNQWLVLAKDAVTLDPIPAGSYSFDVWYI